MGNHKAVSPGEKTQISASRAKTNIKSPSIDGDIVRVENRYWLGRPAARDGLWLRNDLLASAARMAKSRRVGPDTQGAAEQITTSRPDRFLSCDSRLVVGSSHFWGAKKAQTQRIAARKGLNTIW